MLRETLKPEWGNAYGGNVNNKSYMSLCLVTHRQDMPFEQYQPFLLKVIKGGVTSVQLREKKAFLKSLTVNIQTGIFDLLVFI